MIPTVEPKKCAIVFLTLVSIGMLRSMLLMYEAPIKSDSTRAKYFLNKTAVTKLDGLQTPFKLLVLYSYFENLADADCDTVVKRTNLHTFLTAAVFNTTDVGFVFTFSGHIPRADTLYTSIGVKPPFKEKILPPYDNVKMVVSTAVAPDLCHHAQTAKNIELNKYNHVLFLNDGVRGPFTRAPPAIIHSKQLTCLPNWILQHAELLRHEPGIGAVGAVLSCQKNVHIQSYFMLMRTEDFVLHALPSLTSCHPWNPQNDWNQAVDMEIEIGASFIRSGKKLAGLLPTVFSARSRSDFNDHLCRNPYVSFRQNNQRAPFPLVEFSFVKFGGNMYKGDVFNNESSILISNLTQDVIGTDLTDYTCHSSDYHAIDLAYRYRFEPKTSKVREQLLALKKKKLRAKFLKTICYLSVITVTSLISRKLSHRSAACAEMEDAR